MRLIPASSRIFDRALSASRLLALLITSGALAQGLPASTVPAKPPLDVFQPSQLPGKGKIAEQLVQVRAVADVQRVTTGETFLLGFIFDIEPHWHIYWKEPGVSGGPTRIKVKAPQDFAVGRTLFPRPKAFRDPEGSTFGYEGQTVIFVEVTAPEDLKPGQVAFQADVSYMVCKEICLLGRAQPMVTLASGGVNAPDAKPIDPFLATFKARLPKPLNEVSGASASFDGTTLTVKAPAQGHQTAEFFPVEMPGITFEDADVRVEADFVTVQARVEVNPQNAQGKAMVIAGLVGLGDEQSDPCYEFEIPAGAGALQDLPGLLGGPPS